LGLDRKKEESNEDLPPSSVKKGNIQGFTNRLRVTGVSRNFSYVFDIFKVFKVEIMGSNFYF
jgi:hypothetical protein